MNKGKILPLVMLFSIIIVSGALSGCLGEEETESKSRKTTVSSGTVPEKSGWLAYDATEPVTTGFTANGTKLISLSVNVEIRDWNQEHAETDEGSEPDTVQVKVESDGGAFSYTERVTTSGSDGIGNTTIEITEEEAGETLPTAWTVSVTGEEFGGGNNPTGPGGIVPIPFLIYIDQGCEYSVTGSYEYEEQA